MTRPANDKDWIDLVAGYALGNLSSEEATSLKQQLNDNPALAEEITAFQETLSLLPYALPLAEPSANLKRDLLNTASKTKANAEEGVATDANVSIYPFHVAPRTLVKSDKEQRQPSQLSAHQSKRPSRQWTRWAPAISTSVAAVAIAALSLTQIQLHNRAQQTTDLQQQLDSKNAEIASLRNQLKETETVTALLGESTTQVHSLVGPELVIAGSEANNSQAAPSARLLAKAGNREILFVAQDLPQLAPEQIYRLWAVADEFSTPVYCGQFRQDDSGTARWSAPDNICTNEPSKLLITLDAPSDPITSAGPLVLQSEV